MSLTTEIPKEMKFAGNPNDKIRELLHKAGIQWDGHVTNGSLEAQVQVIAEWFDAFVQEVKNQLKVAGDFGEFDHFDGDEYGEQIAIRILKKVRESYGIKS